MNLKELNSVLASKSRALVYITAFILAAFTFLTYSKNLGLTVHLANAFGYLSFSFLSLTLMVTPIRVLKPSFELNSSLLIARRALGVSAFFFAFLHYAVQTQVLFNGDWVAALSLLPAGKIFLFLGFVALGILFLLFATSFDYAVKKLGKNWFTLHKLVYLAYPLILIHAYSIGIDFKNGINVYSGSFLIIAIITLLLEAARIYLHLTKPKNV